MSSKSKSAESSSGPSLNMPSMGGHRGLLNPSQRQAGAKDVFGTLSKLWQYLASYRWMLLLVLTMIVIHVGMGLLGPYVLGLSIDNLMDEQGRGIGRLVIMLGGIYIIFSMTAFLQNYWMIGVSQKTVYAMRDDLFRHLHRLPIDFFVKRRHGELMSRMTNDIDNVSQTLNTSFIQIFSSCLTFIGMLIFMLWLSPLLTFVTLLIVPIMVLGMRWITSRTSKLFQEQQQRLGDLNGYVEETVSGHRVVKLFSQENRVLDEFMEKNKRLRETSYWAQTYSGFIPKLMNVLNNSSFALIAAIGGWLALQDVISVGTILVFAEYARQFTRPLNDLANQFNTLLAAIAGAERVFEVLDEKPEVQADQVDMQAEQVDMQAEQAKVQLAGGKVRSRRERYTDGTKKASIHPRREQKLMKREKPLRSGEEAGLASGERESIRGDIRFENVRFSYEKVDGHEDILRDINLHVKPGETLALVGPTGAGKTTITMLLARFYDPQQGRILLDGHDISKWHQHQLRSMMGFVLQDTFLFAGTIRENIRYGKLDATDEEVMQAAKEANAHSFIMQLPQQYDTILTPDAGEISQGQKQLLAIARAILADPSILILDEATSSIDTITEIKIQEALYRLMHGRTSIVVAHRLNTIQHADQIVVLHEGRILEQGSHDSLLKKRGFYYDLYKSQFAAVMHS